MTPTLATLKKVMATLRPPPKIKLSEWIEKEIHLPATVSPGAPGRVRLYEFQKGIADAISDPLIRRVSVLKSARIGYTTLLVGTIANFVVNDPSLILTYLPNEDMGKSLVTSDLEPTFEESPALRGVLSGDQQVSGGRKNRSNMLMRQFVGGTLKVLSADTERSFRGHNGRIIILDEVDGMNPTKGGHPIPLAETRAGQVADYKLIAGSTPLDVETSYIIPEYEKSDKRVFEIRCVECNEYSEVFWKDIKWPEGEPEKAYWKCPCCKSSIDHKHKSTMVARGRWRVTAPEVKGHAGFKINSLVSPIPKADWGKLAKEHQDAVGKPDAMKAFVTLVLGEGWRIEGDRVDELKLQESAEEFGLGSSDSVAEKRPFPEEALIVTAGVDLQQDRAEITYLGFAEAGHQMVLGHDVLHGNYESNEFWTDLNDALSQKWRHPLGGEIGIHAAALDSSAGLMMRHVYDFVRPRLNRRIVAIKGDDGPRPFIERSKTSKKDPLWIVGVDPIKDTILNRVRIGGIIRFSKDLPPVWYEQFTGEQSVVKFVRGHPTRQWVRVPGRRNEALDCVVYALAARELTPSINWADRREQLASGHILATNDNVRPAPPRKAVANWLK